MNLQNYYFEHYAYFLKKKLNYKCAMLKYGDANSGCLAKATQKNVIYATNTNKEEPDIMKNRSVGTSKSVFVAGDFVGYVAAGVVIYPKGHSAVGRIGGAW